MTDGTETPPSRSGQHLRANRDQAFDAALGACIRALRTAGGLSQGALGEAAGIGFQQVQKYEIGKDRVSASTLFGFAAALNIPPASLYGDGLPASTRSGSDVEVSVKTAVVFQDVGDSRVQRRLMDLAQALGDP